MVRGLILATAALCLAAACAAAGALVLQSDFGCKDGAVAAMKGVAIGVDPGLQIFDLTHEIPAYNIWEGAYRLMQTAPYWPAGTVFVSVVDPGVGTDRRSVVLETEQGHFFVTPDNGTLTLIADEFGIAGVRTIDETKNRLAGSADSYTFYGRDVYAFTGARLASGVIPFAEVGPRLSGDIVRIPYQKATATKSGLHGSIPILDVQYGNVWSNIPRTMLSDLGAVYGDRLAVTILHDGREIFAGTLPFARSFGDVPTGDALVYANSLGNLSVALNCDDFAAKHAVAAGAAWEIHLRIVAR